MKTNKAILRGFFVLFFGDGGKKRGPNISCFLILTSNASRVCWIHHPSFLVMFARCKYKQPTFLMAKGKSHHQIAQWIWPLLHIGTLLGAKTHLEIGVRWSPHEIYVDRSDNHLHINHASFPGCQGLFKTFVKAVTQLYIGVSKNRGTPKWMVYNGKPY